MKKQYSIFLLGCLSISMVWLTGSDTKCDGESFDGEARIQAKLIVGTGSVSEMSIHDFLSTYSGNPTLDDDSPRSQIEQQNVKVTGWLYTYAREGDEDFHLILGSSNKALGRKFISAEISGLPKEGSKDYDRIKKARNQFKDLVLGGDDYCSGFTKRLLQKPIKVTVTGSVFYDTHHPSGGSGTGKYNSKTPWEIHPITSITKAE